MILQLPQFMIVNLNSELLQSTSKTPKFQVTKLHFKLKVITQLDQHGVQHQKMSNGQPSNKNKMLTQISVKNTSKMDQVKLISILLTP